LRKIEFQILLCIFQTYASYIAKEILRKRFILNKVFITKSMFENKVQNIIFYRVYSLNYKGLFLNPISILEYANKALLAKHIKFC
jgi:hypothetical protein